MDPGSITRLLDDLREAAPGAEDRLFERVYDELREIAVGRLAGERPGGGAGGGGGSATELVHDAYERLADDTFENRRHLFFAYTRVMRQVLVDRARRAGALKRGGGRATASLHDAATADVSAAATPGLTAVEVSELLEKLRVSAPREADVVELRFFGGLADDVIGAVLGVSPRTVRQDWAQARRRSAAWAIL